MVHLENHVNDVLIERVHKMEHPLPDQYLLENIGILFKDETHKPCSLSIGNFHSIPSFVHSIISSKAFRGGIDDIRANSSCSYFSHIGEVFNDRSRRNICERFQVFFSF
jgi:hypothetical protein